MNPLKLPLLCILLLPNLLLTTPVAGQQKRRNVDKPAVKAPTPAPAPPTFETLLAADSYKIYGEVRGVGALVRSSAANDVLEPVLKLGGPPKDFVDFVNWMRSHADQLTTSRLLVAAWPTMKDVPQTVIAIEFSSPEEAAKLETPLNELLPTILPPVTPRSAPAPDNEILRPPAAGEKPPAPVPGYALQRYGALLLISRSPVQPKKLRPTGSKPLSEDQNFRVAYNRFASDPVFVFVDFSAMQKEQEEREKQMAEEQKKFEEARKAQEEKQQAQDPAFVPERDTRVELEVDNEQKRANVADPVVEVKTDTEKEPPQAEIVSAAMSSITYSLFSGVPVFPDALGIGFSPENDSFDMRVLMIDGTGKTSDPVPFFNWIKLGAPIAPQSASVIPNDSDLVTIMSLDFEELYTRISSPPTATMGRTYTSDSGAAGQEPPLAALEKLLKIKIKDDLLPLLGSEVAASLPLADYNPFGPPRSAATPINNEAKDSKETPRSAIVILSLRDKEGMRRLLPKLIEGLAGKAAAGLAQTERREETELISYAGMFAYAFVGNFLVFSNDPATVRHVVDSYLKGATLASDIQYRESTRWQPHELQAQLYVSPAFAEDYRVWANSPNARITDEARAFFARFTATTQPISYSLSNDGLGTLHELHVPKSVVLMSVAGAASSANPPATVSKEREAMGTLWTISYAERQYKEKNPAYGSLEELIAAGFMTKEALNSQNYKFDLMITADGYSVSATPIEYGKSGKLSFFLDQTGTLRGADHGGNPASASDPPVNY